MRDAWAITRTSASTSRPCPSDGRITACRHSVALPTTPGCSNSGNTPARTSDDLPPPLMLTISTNARCACPCARSFASTLAVAAVRPKNTGACSGSKVCSPRNGERPRQLGAAPRISAPGGMYCSASCVRCASSRSSKSAGVAKLWNAPFNVPSASLRNHRATKPCIARFWRAASSRASTSDGGVIGAVLRYASTRGVPRRRYPSTASSNSNSVPDA